LPGPHWTEQEIASLIHQVVFENKPLPQLTVSARTQAAINNQRCRLKEAGLLDGAFVGRTLRPWTICKLRELIKLTTDFGFSAAFIAGLQLIPNRSEYAISKMMGRHGLGNPTVKTRATQARRPSAEQRQAVQRFLRTDGRLMPSRQVAALWGMAQKTVNAYRRRLGIALFWQQARASQEYRERQQLRARDFIAHTRKRWRAWREERTGTLERRKQEFERLAVPPPTRICAVCGQQWFATKDFYHVHTRRLGKRLKVTVSRTCRLCRSQQRRQRNIGHNLGTRSRHNTAPRIGEVMDIA
jgi:hypothetical protein